MPCASFFVGCDPWVGSRGPDCQSLEGSFGFGKRMQCVQMFLLNFMHFVKSDHFETVSDITFLMIRKIDKKQGEAVWCCKDVFNIHGSLPAPFPGVFWDGACQLRDEGCGRAISDHGKPRHAGILLRIVIGCSGLSITYPTSTDFLKIHAPRSKLI